MITRIIVEGPDCSGKTTVVERIKNELCWDAKALHHLEGKQFRRYLREYASQENIVFNRGHFSEIVYSKLWRGGNPLSAKEMEILNNICTVNTIIIFACPSLEIMKQRYCERNYPQQIKLEELELSRKYFCEIMDHVPHILYESKDYNELQALIDKVKAIVK